MPKKIYQSPWQTELNDLLRGVAGAFLFGTPFLYTKEVWWKGNFATPPQMMFALGLTYSGLVLINWAAGFRNQRKGNWTRLLSDSAQALAIGLLAATLGLILLNIISFDSGLNAIIGRIVLEGIPFGLGVGLANTYLKGNGDKNKEDKANPSGSRKTQKKQHHSPKGILADTSVTAVGAALGAMISAGPLAPTDEIVAIAGRQSYARLLAIIAASLLLSYAIVFVAQFVSQKKRLEQTGILQRPINETVFAYLISLLMAMMMLWLFNVLRFDDPLEKWVSFIIVLGFPAAIGGATARLVV